MPGRNRRNSTSQRDGNVPKAVGKTLSRRWTILGALMLIGAGVLAYSNCFRAPFIFDDDRCIVRNDRIRQLWPVWKVFNARPATRGVVNVSLALNYQIGKILTDAGALKPNRQNDLAEDFGGASDDPGLDVTSYHVLNLAVHILAGLALFGVVRRTLTGDRLKDHIGNAATPVALVVALIWLLHPLQTSAVTYIIQRAESMMGMFYLLTLYCAIRSFDSTSRSRWAWYGAAILACALGMRTKQVMLTAPLMVLLYDWIFVSRGLEKALRRHWLLYVGLVFTWLLLLKSLDLLLKDKTAGFGMVSMTPWQYARTQPGVILHYLRLALLPVGLCLDYRWPVAEGFWQIGPQMLAIAVLLALTCWALWKRPAVGFLGAWFFGVLSVSSSVIPIADLAFEHRMYLPLAAVICLLVVGGYVLGRRLLGRYLTVRAERRKAVMVPCVTLLAGMIVVLGCLTHARNAKYASKGTMWADVAAKRPNNSRAFYNLGNHYARHKQNAKAVECYKTAIRIQPDYAQAQYNLGNVLRKMNRYEEAIHYYKLAIENRDTLGSSGKVARIYNNLASVLVHQNRLDEAIPYYQRAIQVNRRYAQAYNNLGVIMLRKGKLEQAVKYYRTAVRLKPDYVDARGNLAAALRRSGDYAAAIEQYKLVLKEGRQRYSRRRLAEICSNIAGSLVKLRQPEQALQYYRKAIEIDPNYGRAYYNLAVALTDLNRPDEAIEAYRQAVRVRPTDALAHQNLAMLLGRRKRYKQAIEHFNAAVKYDPGLLSAKSNLAWLLATCRDESLRDGKRAVQLAEEVCKATRFEQPGFMDALSAAYAETGQFEKAIDTAQRALRLASAKGSKKLQHKFQSRLALYQQGKPLRF